MSGEHEKALQDLQIVIDSPDADPKLRSNALIKRGSLAFQLEEQNGVGELTDFNRAIELDPKNPDIYHHRGQLFLLLDKIDHAIEDLTKSLSLTECSPIAEAQRCYALYRKATTNQSEAGIIKAQRAFQAAINKYPKCCECLTLYAQVLADRQDFEKADEYFQRALEIEPENSNHYVHKGMLQLQWKGDVEEGMKYITKAIEIDDKCELAYETLGTIEVQRGNVKRGIELFDKAIPLAKTEVELMHLFSLRDAAGAQVRVSERLAIPLSPFGITSMF